MLILNTFVVMLAGAISSAPASANPSTQAAAEPPSPRRVFVQTPRALGVEESWAEQASGAVASALTGDPRYRVLTAADLAGVASLEQEKMLLGCEERACLARLSELVQVDLVVAGTVGRIGTELSVNLVLLESATGEAIQRTQLQLPINTSLEAFRSRIGYETTALFGTRPSSMQMHPGTTPSSYAVFPLKVAGVNKHIASNLTPILSVEIKRLEGSRVVARDDIQALLELEATRETLGCLDDVSCLVELGGALGVDKLVTGQVGKVAEQYVLSLALLDTSTVEVERRVTESFKGSEEQLIGAVRHAGRRLIGLRMDRPAALQVAASEADVLIVLDDSDRGKLPRPPLTDLEPGRHNLTLRKRGFVDWNGDIYLAPGETTAVWVVLEQKPLAWYQSWWFWTGVGLAATTVAGATAGIAYLALAPKVPTTGEIVANLPQPPRDPRGAAPP